MITESVFDPWSYEKYLFLLAQIQWDPRYRTREDLEDVVQEALLKACRDLLQFRGSTELEFKAWLKTILTHSLINRAQWHEAQRRDIRMERSLEGWGSGSQQCRFDPVADQTSPSQVAMRRELMDQLADVIQQLLEDEQQVILLKFTHGWTIGEIAVRLKRTESATSSLAARAMVKLRTLLQEQSYDSWC